MTQQTIQVQIPKELHDRYVAVARVLMQSEHAASQLIVNTLTNEISALEKRAAPPKCVCCGTTEDLYKDGWYGYRCHSRECVVF